MAKEDLSAHPGAAPRQSPSARGTPSRETLAPVESAPGADTSQANQPHGVAPRSASDVPCERLGSFRLIAKIGQGGMGEVYRAFDEALRREVAVKVLPRELTGSSAFVERFRAEATAVARISHPNVVPIYSIGADRDRHFFAMQLVEGPSLASRLEREQRLNWPEACGILKQCAAGLHAAHSRGLIHRDVKPSNILLDKRTGLAMLVDFGLVRAMKSSQRMTITGVIMGTVDYMAPEQIRGGDVDARADLYALGVVAYEMLAGRLPFMADSAAAMMFQHVHEPPFPLWQAAPEAPRALIDIVTHMMAKSADHRYPGAESVLADLRALEEGASIARATTMTWAGSRSFLAEAPDAAPLTAPVHRWLSWRLRLDGLWRGWSPRWLDQLRTTEQQVDGAVLEYQRRHDQLAELLREAEDAAASLRERKQSYLVAINRTEQQQGTATDDEQRERIGREQQYCRQAVRELEEPERQMSRELCDLRLREAQVNARLLGLVNQRDLLQARLQVARLRGAAGGKPPRKGTRWHWIAAVVAGLLLVCLGHGRFWSFWFPEAPSPDAQLASPITPLLVKTPPKPPTSNTRVSARTAAEEAERTERNRISRLALKAHTLGLTGKGCGEFTRIFGIDPRWMLQPFRVRLVVQCNYQIGVARLMGNLDPRPEAAAQAAWALELFPPDTKSEPPHTLVVPDKPPPRTGKRDEQSASPTGLSRIPLRLGFAYRTAAGAVRRVIGPVFDGVPWHELDVERTEIARPVTIAIDRRRYLEVPLDDIATEPGAGPFWLGAPWFIAEEFRGYIGAFSLADRSQTFVEVDFTTPKKDLLLDRSGWGNHGKLTPSSTTWMYSPERAQIAGESWLPPPGQVFVVRVGGRDRGPRGVELLRTAGRIGLDRPFTCEMWFRGSEFDESATLITDAEYAHASIGDKRFAGWTLAKVCRGKRWSFELQFPTGSPTWGRLVSDEARRDKQWHHLAFCNTPARRQLFLDGKPLLRDETTQADAIRARWLPSSSNLWLGLRRQPAPTSYDGSVEIREFRLSATARYQAAFTPPPVLLREPDTFVLLDIAHRTGQLLADASGNQCEGLLMGAPQEPVPETPDE